MVKHIQSKKTQNAIKIKTFLNQWVSPKEICIKLKVSKQVVSYWKRHEVKETHFRKMKLPQKYINWIVEMAKDKPVSEFSSRYLARLVNKKLKNDRVKDSKGNPLKIGHVSINNILNKFIWKPRKIRKVFYLSEKQRIKRVEFCKMILKRKLTGKEIFFTDETQIDLCNFTNDAVRLSKENEKWLQKG